MVRALEPFIRVDAQNKNAEQWTPSLAACV